jgi:hypothetical protein
MNEFLTSAFEMDQTVGAGQALARMAGALLLGGLVAGIYRWTRGAAVARSELMATLVLLSVLLCLATLVIGDNVARAFSIVGALSIVRFRTVVRDTRDTAFVIAAVTVGMAAGAGYFLAPLLALPVIVVGAFAFAPRGQGIGQPGGRRHEVCVRTMPDFAGVDAVREAIGRCASDVECLSFTQPKGGDGVQRTFEVSLRDGHDLECIQAAVRAVAGVTAVEVRRG